MSRPKPRGVWSVWGLCAAALSVMGCGGARKPAPRQPVTLGLYLPCVIGGPMHKVVAAYEATHAGVEIAPQTYKPLERPAKSAGPAVVITVGDSEMEALVRAGMVAPRDVHSFAVNTYPLAVVAAARGAPALKQIPDLAKPAVKRIFLENPAGSSLGRAAEQAFGKLGLWEKVAPKVVQPRAGAMVLAELLAGKADAAVVFRDCLFAEAGEGAKPPKTIRMIGELPLDLFSPIPYQVGAIKAGPRPEAAQAFVDYLTGEEGRQALRKAGLEPAAGP
jgi:molybdate transport system substrate-binding protein